MSAESSPLSAAEIRSGFETEVRDAVADQLDELVEAGWVTVEGELFTLTATGRAAGERRRGRAAFCRRCGLAFMRPGRPPRRTRRTWPLRVMTASVVTKMGGKRASFQATL